MSRKLAYLLLLSISILIIGCVDNQQDTEHIQQPVWSSFDPLDIPLRQRMNEYKAENLILNHSFEEGKSFFDSAFASFNLKGWKKEGENIEWVDTALEGFSLDDVSDGQYAIKISRSYINESEEKGDGVTSDFIKVMPGNYKLTLDIKLEDVESDQRRLGVGVFDAVNIKLYYFDKNKLPIDDNQIYVKPYGITDISFKGLPFSYYHKIDKIDWSRVIARSHNIPYYEGYMPNETMYVKIHLGLKGKGSMWVDNINFFYTRKNFSPLEKVRPYFDSSFSKYELILPTPKNITPYKSFHYYKTDSSNHPLPYIVIPVNANRSIKHAAKVLKEHFDTLFMRIAPDAYKERQVKIISYAKRDILNTNALFISIGESFFYNKYIDSLPLDKIADHKQGYIVKSINNQHNAIILVGNSSLGTAYAVNTFIQLLDDKSFTYYDAEIIDYPDFENRCLVINESEFDSVFNKQKYFLNPILDFKFNYIYLNSDINIDRWYLYNTVYISRLNQLWEFTRDNAMKYGIFINPYNHFKNSMCIDSIPKSVLNKWYHSSNKKFELLNGKINYALFRGVHSVIISSSNLPYKGNDPLNYTLFRDEDIETYYSLAIAQSNMLNNIRNNIKSKVSIEFSPPWNDIISINNSLGKAEDYFTDAGDIIQPGINFVWTGVNGLPPFFDDIDIQRYKDLTNREIVYLENRYQSSDSSELIDFYLEYPEMIGLLNIFEPYEADIPDNLYNVLSESKFIVNYFPKNEIDRIRYAILSEYLWSTKSYDPDYLLWKVLFKYYGDKLSKELIYFNKYYYQLVEEKYNLVLNKGERKNIRHIESVSKQINNSLLRIGKFYSNHNLVQEIELLKRNIEKEINLLIEE